MARRITGRRPRRSAHRRHEARQGQGLTTGPSRDEVLRFIAENPDRAGKRDIAKAFGAERRRPHLAERPAARSAGRRPADQGAQATGPCRAPCPMSRCSTSSAATATACLLAHPAERTAAMVTPPSSRSASRAAAMAAGARHRRPRAGQDLSDRRSGWPRLYRPGDQGLRQAPRCRARRLPRAYRTAHSASSRSSGAQPELIVDKEFPNGAQRRRSGRGRAGARRRATACRAPRC